MVFPSPLIFLTHVRLSLLTALRSVKFGGLVSALASELLVVVQQGTPSC